MDKAVEKEVQSGRRKPVFTPMKTVTGKKVDPVMVAPKTMDSEVSETLKAVPADFKTGKTAKAMVDEEADVPDPTAAPIISVPRGRSREVREAVQALKPMEEIALPRIKRKAPSFVPPVEEEEAEEAPIRIKKKSKRGDVMVKYKQQEREEQEKDPYKIKSPPPAFVPPTRRGFTRFFDSTFAEEGEHAHQFALPPKKIGETDPDACMKLKASTDIQSFTYQQFIAEYLRKETPYRGLLVYHGLGSGKTCSAIAAAEALFGSSFVPVYKSDGSVELNRHGLERHEAKRRIIVMTPGSLRANFQGEISKCGFRHFRLRTNHWVFIKVDAESSTMRNFALNVLDISEKFYNNEILRRATERRGIWVPDFDKEPNYDDLDSDEQTDIRAQILNILENRITFINYNGVTVKKLMKLVCAAAENPDEPGPFDNSVIVIDEIHNLSRLMQGKLHPFMEEIIMKAGRKRALPPEPVTSERWRPAACGTSKSYTRALLLFRLIAEAKNTKVIGLSGTPLINFPDELGPLFNMIGGYTHAARITMVERTDAAKEAFRRLAEAHNQVDYIQFTAGQTDTSILFTTFLDGYVKVVDGAGKFMGLRESDVPTKSTKQVAEELITAGKRAGLNFKDTPKLVSFPVLPLNPKEFNKYFVNTETLSPEHVNVLKKRLYGLISYYKGASEDLMPKMVEDRVVRVRFSDYAMEYYTKQRVDELAQRPDELGIEEEVDPFGDETSKSVNPANYRFASRAACNFAWPSTIPRPRIRPGEGGILETGETDERIDATISDEAYDIDEDAAEQKRAAEEDEAVADATEEELVEDDEGGGGAGQGGGGCSSCMTIGCTGSDCSQLGGGKKEDQKRYEEEAKRLLESMGMAAPVKIKRKESSLESISKPPVIREEAAPVKIKRKESAAEPQTIRIKRDKSVKPEERKTLRVADSRGRSSGPESRSKSRGRSESAKPEGKAKKADHSRGRSSAPDKSRAISKGRSESVKPEGRSEAKFKTMVRAEPVAPKEAPKPLARKEAPEPVDTTPIIKKSRKRDKKEIGPEVKAIMDRFLTKAAAEAKAKGFDLEIAEPERRGLTYLELLTQQLNKLRLQKANYLRLNGPPDSSLDKYSPKFAAMIRNINDPEVIPGTSLVYSQFYKAEGLGIFGYALEANGYTRIDLKGDTELTAESEASLRLGPARIGPDGNWIGLRFAFFSGEGTPAQRKIILNLFNGNLSELPPKIKRVMDESGYEQMGNKKGEICKVIGITGAGAEGISLKFVRGVHIMEPFWNNVRLEQVKGRAIRICSHAELPPEDRTVSVYTYAAAFEKEDEDKIVPTLMQYDGGITSDQRVLEISDRKKQLSESFIKVLKEVAVDCTLNTTGADGLTCYEGIDGDSTKESHLPDVEQDVAAGDIEERIAFKRVSTAAVPKPIPGMDAKAAPPPEASKGMETRRVGKLMDGREVFFNVDPASSNPNVLLAYELTDKKKRYPVARLTKNPVTGKWKQEIIPGATGGI